MTRHLLLPAARAATLTAALATGVFFAAPVAAQDPAAVGGGGDAALVGGYSRPAARAPEAGVNPSRAATSGEDPVGEVEDLLSRLRVQMSGTAIDESSNNNTVGVDTRGRQVGNALRYRTEVETMVRKHWGQLGPLTRNLYTANYDRSNPDDSERYRSPYGDNGQMENKLLGATDDVQGAMQNMEDLLLPLLQDLKQGFDNGLQQQTRRR